MSECIGTGCTHSSHGVEYITPDYESRDALTKMINANERRILGIDPARGKDESAFAVALDERGLTPDQVDQSLRSLDEFKKSYAKTMGVPVEDVRVIRPFQNKKDQHRKMRSLGMGKHVAGNAHSLAHHKRVPGEVAVGEGKTVSQWKKEQRDKKKKKDKMARKSRRKNR